MERVDPNWAIEKVPSHASRAASESPGPSCPNSRHTSRGSSRVSSGREPGMFGVDGICRTLRDCRRLSLEETMEALFRESRAFTEGEGRHDDTSVVLVEREL